MKKMLKRSIPDKKILFVSACLMIVVQIINLGLFIGRNLYSLCFLDMFALSDMYHVYILFPFFSILAIYILRNEFEAMQVIREKSLCHIWYRICIKFVLTALFLAAVSLCFLSILGLLATKEISTWNQSQSMYAAVVYEVCEGISVWYVLAIYFSNTFISMMFSLLLPFFTYWIFSTYSLGVLFSAAFWYVSTRYGMNYIVFSGCKYTAVQHGFDWKYQFQIPYGLVLLLFFAGALFIRRRDFF